jgi:hypothetical protein
LPFRALLSVIITSDIRTSSGQHLRRMEVPVLAARTCRELTAGARCHLSPPPATYLAHQGGAVWTALARASMIAATDDVIE